MCDDIDVTSITCFDRVATSNCPCFSRTFPARELHGIGRILKIHANNNHRDRTFSMHLEFERYKLKEKEKN